MNTSIRSLDTHRTLGGRWCGNSGNKGRQNQQGKPGPCWEVKKGNGESTGVGERQSVLQPQRLSRVQILKTNCHGHPHLGILPAGSGGIPPAVQETEVLGWEDPPEEGMATHSSAFAGKSQGQRSLAGCSPWGHTESDSTE